MQLAMIGLGRMGARFSSRGEADFADRVLSAMRQAFGEHVERS